jgi:hypothetical protein
MWDVLKPGGRMYLDGSAAAEKFAMSISGVQHLFYNGS